MRTRYRVISIVLLAALSLLLPWHLASKDKGSEAPSQLSNAEAVIGEEELEEIRRAQLNTQVRQYLETKNSPLAQHAEHITSLEHWKLLIAISAIESQYCKRQLSYNCWGIGGDSAYRHYDSFPEAASDADALITRWQSRGRWLTVEDMNCHYVVPCNPNWVRVVNLVLSELDALGTTTTNSIAEDAE